MSVMCDRVTCKTSCLKEGWYHGNRRCDSLNSGTGNLHVMDVHVHNIVERSDNVQMYILLGVQILDVEHTSVHCSINIMYIHLFFLLMTRELYRHVVLCTTHVVCANLKEREAEEVVILMWILCSDLL